jgi:3-methyl-2-oxobutanoate hydroxymethyltransferase
MAKVTVQSLIKKKAEGGKITMLTAYDYPFAKIVDEAGIDIILVGDSLAMVVQGLDNTLPVTMEEMLYHARLVKRAVKNALVVGDMPFMSYQAGIEDTIRNAGRFLKEAGCEAIKLEGGMEAVSRVRALTRAGIPVMAHIGLTPQSVHRMGGYKIQGRGDEEAGRLMEEALALEEAGAFSMVIEAVPMALAGRIARKLSIPAIGIGAGPRCDGQVLVLHDLLGIFERFLPKFAKRYADLKGDALKAVLAFKDEVETGKFPTEGHSFK